MEYISIGQNCASVTSFIKNGIMKNKKKGWKTCFFDLMISSYYGICKNMTIVIVMNILKWMDWIWFQKYIQL